MAKEKRRIQTKFDRPIVKQNKKKAKRKKRERECSIKRFKDGCGICGSSNIAQHGVRYCTKCGEELYYFVNKPEFSFFQLKEIPELKCKCMDEHKYKFKGRERIFKSKPEKFIYVNVCLDCGATQSCYCPVCKQSKRQCWKNATGKRLCQVCNFRSN